MDTAPDLGPWAGEEGRPSRLVRHREALAGPGRRPGGTDLYWAGGPAGPDRIPPQPCRGVHSGRSRSPMRQREGVPLAQGAGERGVEPRRGCCPQPGHSGPQQGRQGGVMPFRGHEQEDLGRNTMTVHSLGAIRTAGVMLPPLGVTGSPRKRGPTAGVEWVLGEQH